VTVYVDSARNTHGRMMMSHMLCLPRDVADLHAMALRIGLRREWFQANFIPHYDVSQSKRALAIEQGAQTIDRRAVEVLIREWRAARTDSNAQGGAC